MDLYSYKLYNFYYMTPLNSFTGILVSKFFQTEGISNRIYKSA